MQHEQCIVGRVPLHGASPTLLATLALAGDVSIDLAEGAAVPVAELAAIAKVSVA